MSDNDMHMVENIYNQMHELTEENERLKQQAKAWSKAAVKAGLELVRLAERVKELEAHPGPFCPECDENCTDPDNDPCEKFLEKKVKALEAVNKEACKLIVELFEMVKGKRGFIGGELNPAVVIKFLKKAGYLND